MTWRWNAFSMRLTPTRPSRTRSELSREAIPSPPDDVGAGDPVVQAALLAVEADPQEAEEQGQRAGQVAGGPHRAARVRRRVAPDVDHADLQHVHAERAAHRDLEQVQVEAAD